MSIKDLVKSMPGAQQVSRVRHRLPYTGSAHYWERRYNEGGSSGAGSYGAAAENKSRFLNMFVRENVVRSVIEFSCGDGNQLSLAEYPTYIGFDVSRTAISMCQRSFFGDPTKSFFLYDGCFFTDRAGVFSAELALSLDVIFHLTEDNVFETYLTHLILLRPKVTPCIEAPHYSPKSLTASTSH